MNWVSTFLVFVESPNATMTAKALGLSQSGVSLQLKKFEECFQSPIFVQEGKKKALSRFGKELYDLYSGALVGLDERAFQLESNYLSPERLEARVGLRRELVDRVSLLLNYPGRISYTMTGEEESFQKLSRHELDFVVSYNYPKDSRFLVKKLFTDGVQLCAPTSFFKGTRGNAKLFTQPEMWRTLPALVYRSDRPFFDQWAKRHGLKLADLKVKAVCEDWNSILGMVEQGIGYALMPDHFRPLSSEVYVEKISEKEIPRTQFYLVYTRESSKVPGFKELLKGI
jgi:DNA-binding transcriptional LysR family regulator